MRKMKKPGWLCCLLLMVACASTKQVAGSEIDGSSFEQAIVVRGVGEEYSYVRGICPECQFVKQSLTFDKRKPYDILRFRTPEGKEVSYYFDISKFFGKGF